ncbi:MLP-like protein 43 isoform X2 [Neltuma alba]|uniref:MLP-like protein 43 isoform X2 n=1 Tax=Neltuma alba TaxID=207710 RepID=UPI0010A3FB77|nr:MLP-like protein 43 isoform X2 [Prosopis alba]
MALTGNLEFEIEIQSPAIEFFNFFTKQLYNLPNATGSVHLGEIHEGHDWHAIGSVKHWSYTVDGKVVTCKERFEELDKENKSVKVELFEGDVKKEYKSFKFILKATEKEGGGGIATWSFFYEKIHEGIPDPIGYLDLAATMTKDVDAHLLLSAQKGK